MNRSSLKTEIHKFVDNSDEKILKVVHTILEQNAKLQLEEDADLSEKELEELDKRWDAYKSGKSKTHTAEETRKEIGKKLKALKHR